MRKGGEGERGGKEEGECVSSSMKLNQNYFAPKKRETNHRFRSAPQVRKFSLAPLGT